MSKSSLPGAEKKETGVVSGARLFGVIMVLTGIGLSPLHLSPGDMPSLAGKVFFVLFGLAFILVPNKEVHWWKKSSKEAKSGAEEIRYCKGCGTQMGASSATCTKCESKNRMVQFGSVGAIVGGFILAKFFGLILIYFFLVALFGLWFPQWYSKRRAVNQSLIKGIVWSNVIVWLFPLLGVLIGAATIGFSGLTKIEKERRRYRLLATIGLVLSLINIIAAILIKSSAV